MPRLYWIGGASPPLDTYFYYESSQFVRDNSDINIEDYRKNCLFCSHPYDAFQEGLDYLTILLIHKIRKYIFFLLRNVCGNV